MKSKLKDSHGIAMVAVIMLMVILLSLVGASLLWSGLDLKRAANFGTGRAAFNAADAGIQHALAVIPQGADFSSFLTGSNLGLGFTCSSPCNGNPSLTGSISGYSYTVTAANDNDGGGATTDKNNQITISSVAQGANNSKRTILAYIGRSTSGWAPPAALYFTGQGTSDKFFDPTGHSYFITGNDTNYDGSTPASPASPIPGIGTNDAGLTTSIINALSSSEKPLVQGLGYSASPLTPSVETVSSNIDINSLAQQFYNQVASSPTCPPMCNNGLRVTGSTCPATLPTPRPIPDPCILGTDSVPQITYLKGGTDHIHLDGNVTGSGVLVLDGEAHLESTFNFHGLVIVKEPPVPSGCGDETCDDSDSDQSSPMRFRLKDSAAIFGSVLVGPNAASLRMDIKGHAKIDYNQAAINMVQRLWGSFLPHPARLVAWVEVMQ